MLKSQKLLFYILCAILFLVFSVQQFKTLYKTPHSLSIGILVPNIVHYVLFNTNTINFMTYLSILSVIKVQKPSVIYIHTNKRNFTGKYWFKLLQHSINSNTVIEISFLILPTHVYGQHLSSIYHASDIARLYILRKYGGIYLDNDMVIINNVNGLRIYDCAIGWPKKQYIGNQFIMAKNNSEFLRKWQKGYKKYRPRNWYYNAGEYPTELLQKDPSLAHAEPVYFGVHNLLEKLLSTKKWLGWRRYYGIHILYRHSKIISSLNENFIRNLTTNFGDIARWILKGI